MKCGLLLSFNFLKIIDINFSLSLYLFAITSSEPYGYIKEFMNSNVSSSRSNPNIAATLKMFS